MSESLKKLKELPVVNKIMQDLDRSIGIKDKVCNILFANKADFLTF